MSRPDPTSLTDQIRIRISGLRKKLEQENCTESIRKFRLFLFLDLQNSLTPCIAFSPTNGNQTRAFGIYLFLPTIMNNKESSIAK